MPTDTHVPNVLPKGKMAVYAFMLNGQALKVGKAGPPSSPRYQVQHYSPASAGSTLARSILSDATRIGAIGVDRLGAYRPNKHAFAERSWRSSFVAPGDVSACPMEAIVWGALHRMNQYRFNFDNPEFQTTMTKGVSEGAGSNGWASPLVQGWTTVRIARIQIPSPTGASSASAGTAMAHVLEKPVEARLLPQSRCDYFLMRAVPKNSRSACSKVWRPELTANALNLRLTCAHAS
jgi:hypothetical protein